MRKQSEDQPTGAQAPPPKPAQWHAQWVPACLPALNQEELRHAQAWGACLVDAPDSGCSERVPLRAAACRLLPEQRHQFDAAVALPCPLLPARATLAAADGLLGEESAALK